MGQDPPFTGPSPGADPPHLPPLHSTVDRKNAPKHLPKSHGFFSRGTKTGSKEVKSVVKEDRREYTGDITHNMDGDVVGVHQIWGGKYTSSLPHPQVQQKYLSIKFSLSPNHWANLSTKVEFAEFLWKWVVDEHLCLVP